MLGSRGCVISASTMHVYEFQPWEEWEERRDIAYTDSNQVNTVEGCDTMQVA
jgi:hypothetical protein